MNFGTMHLQFSKIFFWTVVKSNIFLPHFSGLPCSTCVSWILPDGGRTGVDCNVSLSVRRFLYTKKQKTSVVPMGTWPWGTPTVHHGGPRLYINCVKRVHFELLSRVLWGFFHNPCTVYQTVHTHTTHTPLTHTHFKVISVSVLCINFSVAWVFVSTPHPTLWTLPGFPFKFYMCLDSRLPGSRLLLWHMGQTLFSINFA